MIKQEKKIYIPPDDINVIYDRLKNIDEFIHMDNDVDPLIKLAIFHYQFEAIHPFSDGNGRTGRILNILLLIEKKLLDKPILYLSKYIVMNKSKYYDLLLNVTKNNEWENWILFMLEAIDHISQWTLELINSITKLIIDVKDKVKKQDSKLYSHELIETIFEKPYCRISDITNKNIVKRQTASIYLNKLTQIGVLSKFELGRNTLFINNKLLDLIIANS